MNSKHNILSKSKKYMEHSCLYPSEREKYITYFPKFSFYIIRKLQSCCYHCILLFYSAFPLLFPYSCIIYYFQKL